MHTPCDGLKIMNAECIRKVVPVPPDDVERVACVHVVVQHAFLLDANLKWTFAFASEVAKPVWWTHVALTVRAVLEQLTKVVPVPLGRHHRGGTFYNQCAIVFSRPFESVYDASGNHEIVPGTEDDLSKHRFKYTFSAVHKNHLILVCIFINVISLDFGWGGKGHGAFAVEERRCA